MQVSSRTASLESKLAALVREKASLEAQIEAEMQRRQQLEEFAAKAGSKIEAARRSLAEEVVELRRDKARKR